MTTEKPRREFHIFLPPMHIVSVRADEMQFAGDTMIIWRDGACIAKFKAWQGWIEQFEGEKAERPPVDPLKPNVIPLFKGDLPLAGGQADTSPPAPEPPAPAPSTRGKQ